MIDLDMKNVKELADILDKMSHRAIPFATKQALNQTAFKARQFAQRTIGNKMTERNKWTRGSVRVEMARTLRISQQEAAVGSTEQYMEAQEFGDTEHAKGKHGVAIPTGYSAGQMGQPKRTRLPRRANRLPNIRLANRKRNLRWTKRQAVVASVRMAVDSGNRFIFLESTRKKRAGIYKVIGGRKGKGRGWPKGAKLRMVFDLSKRSVRIPPTPWLEPSVLLASLRMDEFYERALKFQIDRTLKARGLTRQTFVR